MADQQHAGGSERSTESGHGGGWRGYLPVVVPALAFLVGIALGAGAVLLTDTDGGPAAEPAAPTSPADPDGTGGTDGPGDTVVTVPGACERAAQNLQQATELLDEAAGSVRDFRPRQLVDLLNRLEELDRETRELVSQCSSDVDVTEQPAPTEPTASE